MSETSGPGSIAGSILLFVGCAAGIGACALPNLPAPGPSPDVRLAPRQTTHVASAFGGPALHRFAVPGPHFPRPDAHHRQAPGSARAADLPPPTPVLHQVAGRRVVRFRPNYPAGAIVVVNAERALYLVGADHTAMRYPVSIGNAEQQWTGLEFVTAKRANPTWYPISTPGQPASPPVPGGHPDNPLGPRALYLGTTLWRIHGTSAPGSIGRAVSNGCIRMLNEDVLDLYDRIPLGTEVYVVASLSASPPVLPGAKHAR